MALFNDLNAPFLVLIQQERGGGLRESEVTEAGEYGGAAGRERVF